MIRRRRYQARRYFVDGTAVGFLQTLGTPGTHAHASARANRYNRLQLAKVFRGLSEGIHYFAVAEPCDCPAMGEGASDDDANRRL